MELIPKMVILLAFFGIISMNTAYSSEDTIITVTMVGDSVISLDSKNQIIRANVEIENFNPSDGHYFMKIVNTSTGEEIKESEIFPKYKKSQMWGVQIAYIPYEKKLVVGKYEIQIITEFGNKVGKAAFSVVGNISRQTLPVTQIEKSIPTISSSSSVMENEVSIPHGTSVPGCENSGKCFVPSQISIGVGEKVTWKNDDSAAHTVTSGISSEGPDGIFDSSLFMAGNVFSKVFHEEGEYSYFCMVQLRLHKLFLS